MGLILLVNNRNRQRPNFIIKMSDVHSFTKNCRINYRQRKAFTGMTFCETNVLAKFLLFPSAGPELSGLTDSDEFELYQEIVGELMVRLTLIPELS